MRFLVLKIISVSLFIACSAITTWAQVAQRDSSFSKSNALVLPIVYYTPETNLAFGVGGIAYYNFGKDRKLTRPSSAYFYATYTLRNQKIVDLPFHVFSNEEKWYTKGEFAFYDFPFKFYGIGKDIDPTNHERYVIKQTKAYVSIYKRITGSVYLGPRILVDNFQDIESLPNGSLSMLALKGIGGGHNTGIGIGLLYDSRKNVYCAKSGWFVEIGYTNYTIDAINLGGFHNLRLELRKYFKITPKAVLATNFFSNMNIGDVPFYMLSEFGGLFRMRGYYRASYRAKNVMLLHAEWRQNIKGRFGAVLFGGVGSVCDDFDDLFIASAKLSGGAGLRFTINRKEQIPVRADFGKGQGFQGTYFTTGEAF